jgi:hypothetical protein
LAGGAFNTSAGGSARQDSASLIYDAGGSSVGPLLIESAQSEGVVNFLFNQNPAASGPVSNTFINCVLDMPIHLTVGGKVSFIGGFINDTSVYIEASDLSVTTDRELTKFERLTASSIVNTYVASCGFVSGVRATKIFNGTGAQQFPVIVSKEAMTVGAKDFITINTGVPGFYRVALHVSTTAGSTYSITCYSKGAGPTVTGAPTLVSLQDNLTLSSAAGTVRGSSVFYVPIVNAAGNSIFVRGVNDLAGFVWAEIDFLGYSAAGF